MARLEADAPTPAWAARGGFSSITRTADELSVICAAEVIPPDVKAERGWRCLAVVGPLDFSLTGVLASIMAPLATAGVSILSVSTHDTDYVFVRAPTLRAAIEHLRAAGHEIVGL